MVHIPIQKAKDPNAILDFSHFIQDAPAGLWKKENVIMHHFIKINVFVEGSFSVFSDNLLHRPTYGDVCVLSPLKMHYGQIEKEMHIDYYQFNVGLEAFSAIPDGDQLTRRLREITTHRDSFVRPDPQSRETVLRLCRETEEAIRGSDYALAYAKTVEFLSVLYPLYANPSGEVRTAFSYRIRQITDYVEAHYAEDLTRDRIAEALGISPSFLSRIFKKELGVTVHEYLNRYRILKSLPLLERHSVTETGYLCGFCDTSHFISVFKKHMGETPMCYIRRQ